ncbi:MAG: diguanylate cyclase [Clostridia bacterium]|nr:diguanylate cyclase [Clostridia bacterium]
METSSGETLPVRVTVPHQFASSHPHSNHTYGYGTYRLNLVGLNPEIDYGIFIQEESSAYRMRVNGQVMIEYGQVGRSASDHRPGLDPRCAIFRADPNGYVELVMELSNFDDPRGGFWSVPKIGRAQDVLNAISRGQLVEMFLFTANLIMSLIFIALYAKSKQDRQILLLAIFTFLIGFRISLSGYKVFSFFYPFLNWNHSIRLLYLIGFLLLPIFLWMLQAMCYSKPLQIIRLAAFLLAAVSIGLTLLAPIDVFLGYFEIYKYLIVLAALYTLFVVSQGIRFRKNGAGITAVAFAFLIAGTLAEVFRGVDRYPYIVGFSALVMIGLFLVVQIEKFHTIKSIKEHLETEIILDKLTGAYNRKFLEHHLERIIRESEYYLQPLSLILLDLDHFKQVNDVFGHDTGDLILVKTVATVKDVIRSTDPVIRWGGEEFLILVQNADLAGARILAEKLQRALAETDFGPVGTITASFGVTERFLAEPTDIWFKRTDLALYQAKNGGRNQVAVWNPTDPMPNLLSRSDWQTECEH